MFCPNCGVKILDEAKFCFNCGNHIVDIKDMVKDPAGKSDSLIEEYVKEKKIENNKADDIIREALGGSLRGNKEEEIKVKKSEEEKSPLLCLEKKPLKKENVEEIKIEKDDDGKSIFDFDKELNIGKKNLAERKTFDEIKHDAKDIISTSLSAKTVGRFIFDEEAIERRREDLMLQFEGSIKERIFFIYDTSIFKKKVDGIVVSEDNIYIATKFTKPDVISIKELKTIYHHNKFLRIGKVRICIVTEENTIGFMKCLVTIGNLIKKMKK